MADRRARDEILEERIAHLLHVLTYLLDTGLVDEAKAYLAEEAARLQAEGRSPPRA